MKINKTNQEVINEINENGYCLLENCFTNDDLDEMKNSLLQSLNYIKPGNETDLQKKYYDVRDYDRKLKGNWYDIAGKDIVNPIATILSVAMMFQHTFERLDIYNSILNAVKLTLKDKKFTKDISTTDNFISTDNMGNYIVEKIKGETNG